MKNKAWKISATRSDNLECYVMAKSRLGAIKKAKKIGPNNWGNFGPATWKIRYAACLGQK